jgi:hypothetical protein
VPVLSAPAPDPDDRDSNDFVTEDQLRDRGTDPALIRIFCPWATEFRALDGSRCWARADLSNLLDAGGDLQ